MAPDVVRYTSADEDSARWVSFPFRDGDIVISTRSKTGTTWVQMICALLICQTPELEATGRLLFAVAGSAHPAEGRGRRAA